MELKKKTVKNYKELCECFGQVPKSGGRNRKLQIDELKRYGNFKKHIKGNGYDIYEVYKLPAKKDLTTADYVNEMIMYLLSRCEVMNIDNCKMLILTNKQLLKETGFVNISYETDKREIADETGIEEGIIKDFLTNNYDKSRNMIKRALNKLKDECLILWRLRYVMIDVHKNIVLPTEEQEIKMLQIERSIIVDKYGFKNKHTMSLSSKAGECIKECNREICKSLNISNYFNAYVINATKDFIEILMTEKEKNKILQRINDYFYESAIKTANKNYTKALKELEEKINNDSYIGLPNPFWFGCFTSDFYIEQYSNLADRYIQNKSL